MLGAALDPSPAGPPGYFGKVVGFPDFVSRRSATHFRRTLGRLAPAKHDEQQGAARLRSGTTST